MITPLFQPSGSSLCGQTCVAMAAGISLDEAIAIFGQDSATTPQDVRIALGKLGIRTAEELVRITENRPVPNRAIVRYVWFSKTKSGKKKVHGHWILHWDGEVYDPTEKKDPNIELKKVSFLEILEC